MVKPKNQEFRMVCLKMGVPEFDNISQPTIPPGESNLIIRPIMVGICRSDLKEMSGDRKGTPHSFGHELVGEVLHASDDLHVEVGDYVCHNPNIASIKRESGFAERIDAVGRSSALVDAFPQLPTSLLPDRAVFAEPLACAVRCVEATKRHIDRENLAGHRVCVLGMGLFGTLIALVALENGADVLVANRGKGKILRHMSIDLFSPSQLTDLDSVKDKSADVVVVATSMASTSVLKKARAVVTDHGHIQIFGGTHDGYQFPDNGYNIDQMRRTETSKIILSLNKPIQLGGSHGCSKDDFEQSIHLLQNAKSLLNVEQMIERRMPFDKLPAHLISLAQDTEQIGRDVVTFPWTPIPST